MIEAEIFKSMFLISAPGQVSRTNTCTVVCSGEIVFVFVLCVVPGLDGLYGVAARAKGEVRGGVRE